MDKPEILGNVIVIPSDAVYIAAVDEFIENKLSESGVPKSIIVDVAISLSELINNAILHGNTGDVKKKVSVEITVGQDEVEIAVRDQGSGFDPNSVPSPIENPNLLKKVGRGIFIVRSLMDSVDFNFTDDGTEVVIKKNIKE